MAKRVPKFRPKVKTNSLGASLRDRLDINAARAALAEARRNGTISLASAKKRLGL